MFGTKYYSTDDISVRTWELALSGSASLCLPGDLRPTAGVGAGDARTRPSAPRGPPSGEAPPSPRPPPPRVPVSTDPRIFCFSSACYIPPLSLFVSIRGLSRRPHTWPGGPQASSRVLPTWCRWRGSDPCPRLPGLPAGRGWFSHLPDLPPGAPCIRRSAHRLEMCRVSYSSKPCTVSSLLIASAVSPQLILVRSKWPRFLRVSGAFGFLGAVGRCRRDGRGASVGRASCALDFPLHTCQTGASLCRVSLGHPQIE